MPISREAPRFEQFDGLITEQTDFSAAGRRRDKELINKSVDHELELESLGEEWDNLLSTFGSDSARERFMKLCSSYKEAFEKTKHLAVSHVAGESSPDLQQANLHNEIMQTLRNLYIDAEVSNEQRELLRRLQDRDLMRELVLRSL
jgi:hypothetical protein